MDTIIRVSIDFNAVAFMLGLGIIVLVCRLKFRDLTEKKIFVSLMVVDLAMCVSYILTLLRDGGVIPCDHFGAMVYETVLEILINLFAVHWLIYVDYRMYHSMGHLRRIIFKMVLPVGIVVILNIINLFTGIFFYFDDDMIYCETGLYIICDLIRVAYFIVSCIILAIHKKHDERMKFFNIMPFIVPAILYMSLYYISPFNTVTLGLTIGLALIYTSMVNEQCYMDGVTGFYNRLYLDYLRGRMEKADYDLESAMVFRLPEDKMESAAKLITAQLPDDCDTLRYGKETVITLARVNERAPLHMLSEDVEMSLEEAGIPVDIEYELKKKKESCVDFLEGFLRKA